MFSSFPRKDRLAFKATLSLAWTFSLVSGLGGMFLVPSTVESELGPHFTVISAVVLFVSSLGAVLGVVGNRYEVEWVSAWFAAAGQLAYVVVVWYLVFSTTPTRLQQAGALTSLVLFYVYRIVSCSAHARKQRQVHELVQRLTNTGEVAVPKNASDSS